MVISTVEKLKDSVIGKLYGKDVTITDLRNNPKIFYNPCYIPIEHWNPKNKQEWKCEYCNSLNPDNESTYICLYCGAPKR
jgi:hypothetical protein